MKKLALALLMLVCVPALAAADKPSPADFTVKVHVISSASTFFRTNKAYQVLKTTVDGQPMELTGISMGVLALSDYPARISPKIHGPNGTRTYDLFRGYDLLLPDGTTRTYTVTALGPASTNP
jgi:hypothetical protein